MPSIALIWADRRALPDKALRATNTKLHELKAKLQLFV
jgi:hypothetical protein